GVPETDYCTERKQSRESFTKKEFIGARESSMMEPMVIEDLFHLIPFAAECGIREARDRRTASAWIKCARPNGRAPGASEMSDRTCFQPLSDSLSADRMDGVVRADSAQAPIPRRNGAAGPQIRLVGHSDKENPMTTKPSVTHRPPSRRARAARGTARTAQAWPTDAPTRLLMNSLDPAVAERPEDLVVYGGRGRAGRSWEAYAAIVATLDDLEHDETLLIQS